jgi:hypothetical protein
VSSTNNPRSQGRLHTEGIFRRALGDSDTDMQAIPQFDPELDSKFDSYAPHRDPHFGTDSPEPNAQGRVDDLYRRTEPTLDLPSAVSGWREPEHALPPVPPPLDDDDLPPAGRREPWRVLRWALASAATVTVSAVIGLALLTLPDAAQPEAKPSGMTSWLPSWVRDAVVAMAGKPVSTPASTSESVTESAPGSSSKTVAASSPESPAALQPAGSAASQQAAAVPEPDVQSGGTATSDAAQTTAASTVPDTAAASAAEPPSAAPAPVAAAPSTATREASVDDGRVAAASQTSPPPVERATAPAKVAERKSVKTISKQPGAIAEKSGTRERTAAQRPARSEERLVRAAPPGSIFVQHVSLASKADAQAWRARHRGLARTRIIAVNTSGKEIKYAVVSGPFASRKEAEAFAARDGVATAPWFRPQASLRAALPAERH